jgi:Protein UNC80
MITVQFLLLICNSFTRAIFKKNYFNSSSSYLCLRLALCLKVEAFYRGTHDNSISSGQSTGTKESNLVQEKKLINSYVVKSGMLRFNFMLDCCNPGSLPDAHLVAALLDLVCCCIG